MEHRYCNAKGILKDHRKCWCPKKWCYVSKDCYWAQKSAYFPDAGLYYSYESCGEERCDAVSDEEFRAGEEDELSADVQDKVAALIPSSATTKELAELIINLSARIDYLEYWLEMDYKE